MGCPKKIENKVSRIRSREKELGKIWTRHLHARRSHNLTDHFWLSAKAEVYQKNPEKDTDAHQGTG